MRRVAITLLCAGLLECPVASARAQSLYGPGGLFLHPTADVPPKGQLTAGALGLAQRFTLIAEARPRGQSDFKTSTALSLAYQYGTGNRLVITWANTGQSTQPRFGFGVGYAIGGRR